MPLRPCLVLQPHRCGERRGLISLDMGDVGLDFLLRQGAIVNSNLVNATGKFIP